MALIRFKALESVLSRPTIQVTPPSTKLSDFYGIHVFDLIKMRQYLSKEAYDSIVAAIDTGTLIERSVSDQVASAMKAWAMEKGCTHYTHWFQPLTGTTAETGCLFLS
jgi:glutamine synthetase